MPHNEAIKLVNKLNKQQSERQLHPNSPKVSVLFNKGRYFEMTPSSRALLVSISKAIKSKIQFDTMLVDNKDKLEALVKAFNKRGYYVNINLDWI